MPDILVIGGGVIGCAVAYELSKKQATVVLVERGEIGQEASSAAAGMLSPMLEPEGDDGFARLCLQARSLFPDYLEELGECTGVPIEWHHDGWLYLPMSEEEAFNIQEQNQNAGPSTRLLSRQEVREMEPHAAWFPGPALYSPDPAHLDNAGYTRALAEAAKLGGVEVRTHEEIDRLLVRGDTVYGARTSRGEIHAAQVINCSGAWASHLSPSPESHLPVVPVRGQMLSLTTETPLVRRLVCSKDCYLVPRDNGQLLVGATIERVGYDKRNTADAIQKLTRGALDLCPDLKSATFSRMWAGLRPGTPDSLPILGIDPAWKGLIHATGHFRNGILLSALTGKIMAELVIEQRSTIPLDQFSPARFRRARTDHEDAETLTL
jgi:glycine oxidase